MLICVQLRGQLGKVHELGIEPGHGRHGGLHTGQQLVAAKIGKGWGSTQTMHVGNGLGNGVRNEGA